MKQNLKYGECEVYGRISIYSIIYNRLKKYLKRKAYYLYTTLFKPKYWKECNNKGKTIKRY